jgi:signal transduction histidine kinase
LNEAALAVMKPENCDLSAPGCRAESLDKLAHDARNLVTALDLYCDLLREPGVLAEPFAHYGSELKHVAATSRLLVERLAALHGTAHQETRSDMEREVRSNPQHRIPAAPIDNLAAELLANRNLLAALAGPKVAVSVNAEEASVPVGLSAEDLTRILVNLVKNATEAMSSVGSVHITLRESASDTGDVQWLTLNVEDNGPGFSDSVLGKISEGVEIPQTGAAASRGGSPLPRRGLGLAITRSIVEAAGGRMHAANRDPVGACIQIELPLRRSLRASSVPAPASDTNAVLN